MRKLDRCIGVVAICMAVCCTGSASAAVISNGGFRVEINKLGVLVGLPSGSVHTVDGPTASLSDGFAEWFGVSFDSPSGHVEAVASGTQADWADRTPVEAVAFHSTGTTATSVARIGDLQIRTEFWFDPDGPYLITAVTLTNTGTVDLRGMLYTRECISGNSDDQGWTFPYDIPGPLPAPDALMRRVWMMNDIRPGASVGLGLSYAPTIEPSARGADDVPLSLWTNSDFPGGVPVGLTNGISFGDYDADGWIDMFACQSANLWRNVDGQTWEFAADLNSELPFALFRYGSSFGDYNNDGLPDIATEPREAGGDDCVHLLKNLGGGPNFVDVATDPKIMNHQACDADAETICWGDVDVDGDLDMFFPAYPPWASGADSGNSFYRNLGPDGETGTYRLEEFTSQGGFHNPPPDSARPEGAQFTDLDFDGDMDLYSNGTLYQNVSQFGLPLVKAMTEGASGIGFSTQLEEGAAFADYDLDGDYDLLIVYTLSSLGVRIWENYGDGMFFGVESGVVESPSIGLDLGLSSEDWDNDGDMDFTTRQVFRRNMLVETGQRSFIVASHSIPSNHLTSATPAWGDWDRDGDLDCALGNWLSTGHFYENTIYDASTPPDQRRFVRIRPLTDSTDFPAGLETQYATSVEIRVAGDKTGYRRKKFTASSAGYLNQNEYTLHFALPDDPDPADPDVDLLFDVTLDFPNLPADGMWRVDKHVNDALGNVHLADLVERQITVFRSGIVTIDSVTSPPSRRESPVLITAGGGLALPSATAPLSEPKAAPAENTFVGLDFETEDSPERLRIREIILDGTLDAPVACEDTESTTTLWDVTDVTLPIRVAAFNHSTSLRNRRSYFPTDILLEAARKYRLVARVSHLRETSISGPIVQGALTVLGGLSFQDESPCSGEAVAAAKADPKRIYLSIRVGTIEPADFDFDEDEDVDLDDFAAFQSCLTGPDQAGLDSGCEVFDSNLDQDIDQTDFAAFQVAFTG